MSTLRLYAHALTLAGWAFVTWVFQVAPEPGVAAGMLGTLACAALVAERERARRRR